jgi:hypothetical protein
VKLSWPDRQMLKSLPLSQFASWLPYFVDDVSMATPSM